MLTKEKKEKDNKGLQPTVSNKHKPVNKKTVKAYAKNGLLNVDTIKKEVKQHTQTILVARYQ